MRSHSLNYIEKLPTEIIKEIYILSLNLSLPHTCRRFFQALNSRIVRLHFCKQAFSSSNSTGLGKRSSPAPSFLWTEIFLQKWFTPKLSADLEAALNGPGRSCECFTTGGAYLPKDLLNGPFTTSKVRCLCRLIRWTAQLHPRHQSIAAAGLHQAIREGNRKAVRMFLSPPLRVYPHLSYCETWATSSHDTSIGKFLIGKRQSLGEAGWENSDIREWYRWRLENDPKYKDYWELLANFLGRSGIRLVDSLMDMPEEDDFEDGGDEEDREYTVYEATVDPMSGDQSMDTLTKSFAKACLK